MLQPQRLHRIDHALCDGHRAFHGGVRQNHGKLFPAIARHQIGLAVGAALNGLGHGLQAGITLQVPIAVVVALEVIHINQHHAHRPATAPRHGAGLLQPLIEVRAVGNPQQSIGIGQRFQACVGFLQLFGAACHARFQRLVGQRQLGVL